MPKHVTAMAWNAALQAFKVKVVRSYKYFLQQYTEVTLQLWSWMMC